MVKFEYRLKLTFVVFSFFVLKIRSFGVAHPFPFGISFYFVRFYFYFKSLFSILAISSVNQPPAVYWITSTCSNTNRMIEKNIIYVTERIVFFPYIFLARLDLLCERWRWKASQTCTHLFLCSLLLSRFYLWITSKQDLLFCCDTFYVLSFCLLVRVFVLARKKRRIKKTERPKMKGITKNWVGSGYECWLL